MFGNRKPEAKKRPTAAERRLSEVEAELLEGQNAYAKSAAAFEQIIELQVLEIKHLQFILARYESAERALALSNQAHGVAMKLSIEKHVVVSES